MNQLNRRHDDDHDDHDRPDTHGQHRRVPRRVPRGRRAGLRTRRPRAVAVLASTAVALAGVLIAAAPAQATLSAVGPVDPTTQFPAYYTDTNGVSLQMCLDGPPLCMASFDDLVTAHNAGLDAEAFYFNADAEVGGITVSNALEAAYAGDGPDQEIVFVRNQIANQTGGLVPGGTYTVTDPYGTLRSCVADVNGEIRNNACRTELVPPPRDFSGSLAGRIGPFLTWDTYGQTVGGPPAGYIGDGVTPHRVVGSPTGFNKVRITGPGINADRSQPCAADWTGPAEDCGETDLFVVQGKVQPGRSASLNPSGVLDFGNTASAASRTLRFTSTGSEPVTVTSVVVDGGTTFTSTEGCTTAGPLSTGQSCTIDVTYTPPASPGRSTGTVTVTDDTGTVRSVTLQASTVGKPTLDRTSVAFGNQKINTRSAGETLVVGNDGTAPLTVATPTFTGTGQSHFRIESNGCQTPVPPASGCEIAVSFLPSSTGAKTAALEIPTDGGNVSVALTGTGTSPVVTIAPTSVAFPDTNAGSTSTTRSATFTNGGTANLFVEGSSLTGTDASQFRITGGTCTMGLNLAPGNACNLVAAFAPGSAGAKSATLNLLADGTAFPVPLSGNGVAVVTAPGAPTIGTATGGNGSATVTWSAPANTGGSPITSYTVEARSAGGTLTTVNGVAATARSATVTGLTNGTSYTLRVRAVNAVGPGAFSTASNAVTPTAPAAVPGAPTIGTASRANASAVVRWTRGSAGSSPITSHQIQVIQGTTVLRTVTGIGATATSATVTGLTNGSTYTFRVRAVNAAGAGALSAASNAVTPATVPGAPVIGTATSGAAGGAITATANWSPPTSTGGSSITGYVVRALRMSATGAVLSTTTSAVQPASARSLQMTLPVAGNYRFTVQARNSVGSGAQSARSNQVAGR